MKLIIFISYINLKRNLKKKYKKKKMISNITHSPCLKTEHEELVENRWTTSLSGLSVLSLLDHIRNEIKIQTKLY